MKPHLLLVEEPSPVRGLQVLALESQGWRVTALADVPAAITLLHAEPVRLLVVAAGLLAAGAAGLEALRRALEMGGTALQVMAFPAEQDGLRRLELPVAGVLARPLSLGALVERVRPALPPGVDAALVQLVRDVVSRSEEAAARVGCQLHAPTEPTPGRWDAARLSQVMAHLLSNAMKFGSAMPVEVALEAEPDTVMLMMVRDYGIGIAPGRVDGLFQRFERAVPVRHYGGLGLYRPRRIVEAQRGEVSVHSTPGEGSTFRIRLPRAGPPPARPARAWDSCPRLMGVRGLRLRLLAAGDGAAAHLDALGLHLRLLG
ncbi:sensor histidine kinase KdpD [Myxococcus sp. RHSTA-1-4]|uniref:sensor histidine kinase n=1 Tax=Myxococcus sp. RHSTA-1-4 TaxID=2874601 RepID=UPI001CBB4A4C|nr:ATP-binding protein [Myxococcus sp. RHSTA-1-4]MBZ4417885.1 ATP-binding protein [Myxococcus sp. RHSTA-1-4]